MADWRANLSSILEERGISDKELSRQIHTSESYVRKVLREGTEPTLPKISEIRKVLGITWTELLGGGTLTPRQEQLMEEVAGLDDEALETALDMIAVLKKRRAPSGNDN